MISNHSFFPPVEFDENPGPPLALLSTSPEMKCYISDSVNLKQPGISTKQPIVKQLDTLGPLGFDPVKINTRSKETIASKDESKDMETRSKEDIVWSVSGIGYTLGDDLDTLRNKMDALLKIQKTLESSSPGAPWDPPSSLLKKWKAQVYETLLKNAKMSRDFHDQEAEWMAQVSKRNQLIQVQEETLKSLGARLSRTLKLNETLTGQNSTLSSSLLELRQATVSAPLLSCKFTQTDESPTKEFKEPFKEPLKEPLKEIDKNKDALADKLARLSSLSQLLLQ